MTIKKEVLRYIIDAKCMLDTCITTALSVDWGASEEERLRVIENEVSNARYALMCALESNEERKDNTMVEISENLLKTLAQFGSMCIGEIAYGVDGGDLAYISIDGSYITITNEAGETLIELDPDIVEAMLELFRTVTSVNE